MSDVQEKGSGSIASSGDGSDMKRSHGRPKGSRDIRPRVKRKSDTWPEDEQQGEAKDSSLRTQGPIPMLSSTAALSSAANTMSSALDLQRLLSYSGAPLHHDKAGGARSQQVSSSNTSHSQSSSYHTDDSHSGYQGSRTDDNMYPGFQIYVTF